MRSFVLATLGAALLFACGGSTTVPAPKLADSKAAIRAAEEMGAEQNPQAALHLKMARDQFNQAQALINDGESEEAKPVLDRAQIDAELALTLARLEKTEEEAREAQQKIRQLKERAQ